MSSLGLSLLLLVVVAIAVVVGYNLRQGAWPRWEQAIRGLVDPIRASAKSARRDALRRRDAEGAGNGRRGTERGEPRLGRGEPDVSSALDDANAHVDGLAAHDSASAARAALHAAQGDARPAFGDIDDEPDVDVHANDAVADDRATPPDAAGARPSSDVPHGEPPTPARSPFAPPSASAASAPSASPARDAAARAPSAASTSAAPAASTTARSRPVTAGVGDERLALDASLTQATPPVTTAGPAASGPALSEACDCIVELAPASPLAGERLLAIAQRLRRAGSKPVSFDARARALDDGFELPVAGRSYERVRVGVLLANRHGPLNAMEFSEFVSAVQEVADTLPAHAEMPAMGSVLARARDLDSTCAQLDVQIGVSVEAPEAVEPAQLAALAPALGLVERGSHRYVRQGPQGEPLFSLGFSDSPSRLTFLLDVPRVAASLEPFGRMVQAAGACAQRLGASLVDDSGRPLAQASLVQIARQLDQRYESLEAIGLPAGSTLACKVFN